MGHIGQKKKKRKENLQECRTICSEMKQTLLTDVEKSVSLSLIS